MKGFEQKRAKLRVTIKRRIRRIGLKVHPYATTQDLALMLRFASRRLGWVELQSKLTYNPYKEMIQ